MDASPAPPSPCRSGRRRRLPLAAGVGVLALVCGCAGPDTSPSGAPARQAVAARAADGLEERYQDVITDVLPSVVQIAAGDGLGSGVVYDDKGHIVTNAHVVAGGKTFDVSVPTGEKVFKASLVSSYPEQDLAVVKLNDLPAGLKAARFDDTDEVEVGQIVLAMGSPLGLSGSVTQGIVSAVGRTVSESGPGDGTGATLAGMVQTSAAINPGNSGGALVNLDSEVIGIPTLAAAEGDSAAPGIGFAIPVSTVRTVAEQIIKSGKVTDSGRAALDITGRTVLDAGYRPAGVAIVSVEKGGAAQDAGLRAGDVITRIDGTPVTTITSLSEALADHRPGDEVEVTYVRGDAEKSAEVTLGEM
ncbi:S1C family serine protease [Kitasatospora cinereorecta]